jgi:hypothetical protein
MIVNHPRLQANLQLFAGCRDSGPAAPKLLYADTEYPFQCELFHSPSISGGTNIERASAGRLQR